MNNEEAKRIFIEAVELVPELLSMLQQKTADPLVAIAALVMARTEFIDSANCTARDASERVDIAVARLDIEIQAVAVWRRVRQ